MSESAATVAASMAAVLLFGLADHAIADSTPVLDQSQLSSGGALIFFADHPVAQTFTAGITGQLTTVGIRLDGLSSQSSNVTVQIVKTIDGAPSGDVLGSLTQMDPPDGFYRFDFTFAAITLQAGTQYGIVLSDDDPSQSLPGRTVGVRWVDLYSGGALWDQWSGSWELTMLYGTTPGDAAFGTWMISDIPEPANALAVPALLFCLRRRPAMTRRGRTPDGIISRPDAPGSQSR